MSSSIYFEADGVYIHTADGKEDVLAGKLQLIVKEGDPVVEWNPINIVDSVQQSDPDGTVVNTGSKQATDSQTEETSRNQTSGQTNNIYPLSVALSEVKSIRAPTPNLEWPYLVFKLTDDQEMSPLHFHEGRREELISVIKEHVTVSRSASDKDVFNVHPRNTKALSTSFTKWWILPETISTFYKDRMTAIMEVMGSLPMVANFFRGNMLASSHFNQPQNDYSDLLPTITTFNAEQDFLLITKTENKLAVRPAVVRGTMITKVEWQSHQDEEGRIMHIPELKEKIFRGGIEATVRRELWPFLLCYYPWTSTTKERIDIKKNKEDEYFGIKTQWNIITADQERRFSSFKARKNLIDNDVKRTDRVHPFFAVDNHLDQLFSILMTYAQFNFDLGYVQGMSDILAPILLVMEDEVDAFWCFVGYMDHLKLEQNFDMSQEGMKNQLIQLNTLIQVIEPEFYGFLQSKESSDLLFCFEWLLIHFKRQFPMKAVMRLWEVMWTGLPCQNFHLLLCVAILDGEKDTMMKKDLDGGYIVQHLSKLSLKLNVEEVLRKAEGIFLQLKISEDLPEALCEIMAQKETDEEESSQATESRIE